MEEKNSKYQRIVISKGYLKEINFQNAENNYEKSMIVLTQLSDLLKNDLKKSIDAIKNLDDEKASEIFRHGFQTVKNYASLNLLGTISSACETAKSIFNDGSDKKEALISKAEKEYNEKVEMIGVLKDIIEKLKLLTDALEKITKKKSKVGCSLQ